MTINIRSEVLAILGRAMTKAEARIFRECRAFGFANPYDIVAAFGREH